MTGTVVHTQVLVLGAGSAASRAALESVRAGANTIMVTKGRYGNAGTSSFHVAESAGFSASGFADPTDTPEHHKADILEAGLGPCSAELAEVLAENAPRQVPFLEGLGVVYERYLGGYLATRGCFANRRRSMKIKGHGTQIVNALKAEILRDGRVHLIEHSMALELIVENGACRGAFVLTQDGDLLEIRAGAVILGTGGAGQLFHQSLNPSDITGDGYALGYRAGAKLVNMEFMQSAFGVVRPAKTVFNAWLWSLRPELTDETGRAFLQDYLPRGITLEDCARAKEDHYPFSSRDVSRYLEIAVKKHCNLGHTVYADLRHVGDGSHVESINLAQMWPITRAWMQKCGVDVDAAPVELLCYAHAISGGILVDRNAQSSVLGLYAVGEVAGGMHGADRLGGNMFAGGQVFGETAGRHAAQTAPEGTENCRPPREYTPQSGSGTLQTADIRPCLQELSYKELLVVRTGAGLQQYLRELKHLEHRLTHCTASSVAEQMQLAETHNLLITGRLVAQSALARTESRGSHYREDFPTQGGDQWRDATIHQLKNGVPTMYRKSL